MGSNVITILCVAIICINIGFYIGDHFGVNAKNVNIYRTISDDALLMTKRANKTSEEAIERLNRANKVTEKCINELKDQGGE